MVGDELFEELPEQAKPQTDMGPAGKPRLREPKRDQPEWRMVDDDSLIADDHLARTIWAFTEPLDLSEFDNRIKARGSKPGAPTILPRLMLALWGARAGRALTEGESGACRSRAKAQGTPG